MMPVLIPEYYCLVAGVGVHKEDKNAQDMAGHEAGIADRNVITVSSVLPPGCREISKEQYLARTRPGQIILVIDGQCKTNEEGQIAAAALAVAIPDDPEEPGYFTELFETPGIEPDVLRRRVETMSLQLLATRMHDDDFVADDQWEDGKDRYEIAGKPVTLKSIVASGLGTGDGNYTCAYVGAILL